jgi:hypothetical protein
MFFDAPLKKVKYSRITHLSLQDVQKKHLPIVGILGMDRLSR